MKLYLIHSADAWLSYESFNLRAIATSEDNVKKLLDKILEEDDIPQDSRHDIVRKCIADRQILGCRDESGNRISYNISLEQSDTLLNVNF